MPRHDIGQQVQRSSAGSIPHDRITTLQICSARSLPLDRPRQSASRHPPVVTNRPTTYRVRRHPRLIQPPLHRPPACWSASTPFTHLIRGTQIPIAKPRHPRPPPAVSSLGGLRTPAPRAGRATVMGPPSANLHNRVTLTARRSLPVFLDNRTSSVFVGMSQTCQTDNRSIMTKQGSQTEREPRVAGKQWSIGVRRGIHLPPHIAESAGRGTETAAT